MQTLRCERTPWCIFLEQEMRKKRRALVALPRVFALPSVSRAIPNFPKMSTPEYSSFVHKFSTVMTPEVEPLKVGPNIATHYAGKLMPMRRVRSWLMAPKISENINIFLRKTFETNYSFALTVRRVITHPIWTPIFFVILSASRFCSSINGSTSVFL